MPAAMWQEDGGAGRQTEDRPFRATEKDRVGDDNMQMRTMRCGAEAEAERRRDLDPAIIDAAQTHPEQQLAHQVERR